MKTKAKKSDSEASLKKAKQATIEKKKGIKELSKNKAKELTKIKKVKPLKKSLPTEGEVKKNQREKKNLIKESKLNPVKETRSVPPEKQGDQDGEKKKKKNRRHRKSKSLGLLLTKLSKKNVKTLEAAEKLAEKKLESLKEVRAKRKNKLFVACKKKITGEAQIKALHPDIKSIVFPRKSNNSKYCWISFETPRKALEAFEILKNEKEYHIQKPKTNINNIDLKAKAKQLLEKSQKRMKKKTLAASWS